MSDPVDKRWRHIDDGSSEASRLPERSPFEAPQPDILPDRATTDPSVFEEPWMRSDGQVFFAPPEPVSGFQMFPTAADPEHSVWDEPALAQELSGDTPDDAVTWLRWCRTQAEQTSAAASWAITLLVAAVSGVCAIAGVFFLQPPWQLPLLMTVIAAPITEEILKIAVAIWICEKRPWLFHSPAQILICGLASGLMFATVENLIYLNIYVPDSGPGLAAWRWSVCTLLHAGCSVTASIGVVRVWTEFQRQARQPRLADGSFWFILAMVMHGTYNFVATLMESFGGLF